MRTTYMSERNSGMFINNTRRELLKVAGTGALFSTTGIVSGQDGGGTSGGAKQWTFSTGGAVQSSPTVVDGTVFVGSDDNNVYALDANTGAKKWDSPFETGGDLYSSPAVTNNSVYIADESGVVYAINADDGTEQWQYETGASDINSSPTVANGTVYIGAGDQNVYAVDAADGTERWDSPFSTDGAVDSSPTVSDGTVYVGSSDNSVYAISADDGSENWSFETGDSIISSPTVANGTVYVGSYDFHFYAIDADSGEKEWRRNMDSGVYSSPTVADGAVYAADYSFGTLFELQADSGERTPIAPDVTTNPIRSSPTVADGVVYIGDGDGTIYAFDPTAKTADRVEQWRFSTDGVIESSPTVVDGTVYVGSNDGTVYALDAGVEGSSEGSRVTLGTLGHHSKAAETGSSDSPPAEITVDRDTLQFGANVIGGTPTRKFTITNNSEREVRITPESMDEITFIEESWMVDEYDSSVPPFDIPKGETVPLTIELDTAEAFESQGSDVSFSLPFYANEKTVATISVEAAILNDSDTLDEMATAAQRTAEMFSSEAAKKESVKELFNAYINIAQITYELSDKDYSDAEDELTAFRDNINNIRHSTSIGSALNYAQGFQEDDYYNKYTSAASNFETAATRLEKDHSNQEAAKKFDDGISKVRELADEWVGDGGLNSDRHAFKKALQNGTPATAEDVQTIVEEYTTAITTFVDVTTLSSSMLTLTASPVNTTVADPEGRVVGPDRVEIPNGSYHEVTLDGEGSTEELIVIQDRQPGSYDVDVTAEQNADTTDSYSIGVSSDGGDTQLADKEQIQSIPSDGYTITSPSTVADDGLPTDPGEPSFQEVLEVLQAHNTGERYNGVDVGFQDVLEVVSAYNAG
ncbi:PQQ-binding-like beta-propeller repeat protein [Natrinema longum]|uniref:PQQ-binding-like beta-propeller repeat protein n=1 Tax=Natrinema longum TaxID=370324 RepID=A0A8A2UAW2_9EURY|nr:PQQ-binding-like beta-propeller repeat protein [Natrinema longum]MBZ6496355.1 PQQ-binding-like beta-propeller repeat protein [Natrinema longum]QSW85733.1 PQQ-binding-like beta-propeller repeat protein [Natrinema longum]